MGAKKAIVAGGGIAGLAAALRLAEAGVRVTLIEGADRVGGKLRTIDGWEAGAENFLMRDPAGGPSAAAQLAAELGLEIVHPSGVPAALYLNGALTELPKGTMLGIPGPQARLDGIADVAEKDTDAGAPVLAAGIDVAVGELVRDRMGDDVVSKLVDPLLGGVYAGRADALSLEATMPGLHRLLQTEHTLSGAVARTMREPTGPIFGTVPGGLSRLIEAATARLIALGGEIRLGRPLRDLSEVDADGVVLAMPAGKARRLLAATEAAQFLKSIDYASVALVTLEYSPRALPELSGFLVPEGQGLHIKAATFFTRKWEHLRGDTVLIRASLGRYGSAEILQQPDDALIEVARRDLAIALGGQPPLVKARVDRWGGGLPQYAPGHVARVRSAREALAPTNIELAGAGYDGIGIPVCIKSGRAAAEGLMRKWEA